MFLGAVVSMRPALVMLVLFTLGAYGKVNSRTNDIPDEEKTDKRPSKAPPAIVAIEIIDPNENKTSKNAKRTIESSLGYGYQGYFGAIRNPPRFQVYKYSQHDIPAYRGGGGGGGHAGGGGVSTQNFHIQKSVSYDLPTQTVRYTSVRPSLAQYYQPGTTLYSTLDHGGRLAALSSNVPRRPHHQHSDAAPVPVIILRVHPDSLRNPGTALYPQLPRSNPYAAQLNTVDVQGLLSNYIENMLRKIKIKTDYHAPQPQQQQHEYLPPPQAEPPVQYLSEGQAVYQPADHPQQQQQVVEYQQATPYQQQGPVYQAEPQAAYPEPTGYQQQAYAKYTAPSAQEQYEHYPQQQEYQETPVQTQEHEGQAYQPSTLLTHENYPDDTHTRVIFRTREGHVQTTTPRAAAHASPTPAGSGVIKISVPDASYRLSSVEVRTPETQYSYTPGPDAEQLRAAYEAAAQHQQEGHQGPQSGGEQPQFYYIAPGAAQDYQGYQQGQVQQQEPPQEPQYLPPQHQQQEPQYLPSQHQQQETQYLPPQQQQQEPQYLPPQQQQQQYVTPRVVVRPRGQPLPQRPPTTQHKRRSRSKTSGRRVRPTTAVKHVTELPAE